MIQKWSGLILRQSARRWLSAIMLCAGLLPAARIATAQQLTKFGVGTDFIIGVPVGEFHDQNSDTGLGASFSGVYAIGRSPFHVGGEFGFAIYGMESHRELFRGTTHDVVLRVDTTYSILLGNVFLRIQPREGSIRPYVDGLIGLKYLVTSTSLSGDETHETVASEIDSGDTALSYGVGGGVQFLLTGRKGRPVELLLDIGARYLRGGQAEYLRKGSITYVDDIIIYNVLRSNTDMFVPKIGLAVRF